MELLFRADGNKDIGWGHVMRSLSIASEARNMGAECFFVCADTSLKTKIEEYGFSVSVLNSDYSKMDNELQALTGVINEIKPDYIIVDSYYVTNEYLKELKNYSKTVYIDDVFAFPYDVDNLINYNIYASESKYLELYNDNDIPVLLLGLRYVPLRIEFKNVNRIFKAKVENVFVSTGGSDEFGLVLRIINNIISDESLYKDINYHFIIGGYEPDRDAIYEIANEYSCVILHENVRNMSELMGICDVAVSAAGSTLYELCACGVPTITYVIADNQIDGAREFERKGLMINSGDLRETDYDCRTLINNLRDLISDNKKRKTMSESASMIVDGNGAKNILNDIMQYNEE